MKNSPGVHTTLLALYLSQQLFPLFPSLLVPFQPTLDSQKELVAFLSEPFWWSQSLVVTISATFEATCYLVLGVAFDAIDEVEVCNGM